MRFPDSHFLAGLAAFLLLVSLSACGSAAEPAAVATQTLPLPTAAAMARSAVAIPHKQRITAPEVTRADLYELVAGNGVFAFDLYHVLRRDVGGNLFYSPYSISAALAMAYAGAEGETSAQMANTMGFTLPQERLHPAFNSLDLELTSRSESGNSDVELNIANALWGKSGYQFRPRFLDTLAENYGATLRQLDFTEAPAESAAEINQWANQTTNGRIPTIITPDKLNKYTRLIITNAIYFKGLWLREFNENSTQDDDFFLSDGNPVKVPMMRQRNDFLYGEGEDYQAIELPYRDEELSMIILLPREGRFEDFEKALDAQRLREITDGMEYREVILRMPRFKLELEFSASEVLKAMGMPAAFDPIAADFSGMADFARQGNGRLYISEVFHKAFVAVDESGTEAAAATAVVMLESESLDESLEMTVNRPFFFLIRDSPTNSILFVGRVIDPR